jgi:hypothetical protein
MIAIDYSTVRLLIRLLLVNDGEMCRPVLARFDATDCKIRKTPRPREWNRSAMGSGEEADPDMQSVPVSTIAMGCPSHALRSHETRNQILSSVAFQMHDNRFRGRSTAY